MTSLKPDTRAAFEAYVKTEEAKLPGMLGHAAPSVGMGNSTLRPSAIAIKNMSAKGPVRVTEGIIHDWVGAMVVPGATAKKTLDLLQDYERDKEIYKGEVLDSKLLRRDGNKLHPYLQIYKKKVITVILNTEYDVEYNEVRPGLWLGKSYSTKIAELANPGKSQQELPVDTGHGFMWRFNTYWMIEQRKDGVYVECRAISLSRSIPRALAWIIEPFVSGVPKESLENTLRITREQLLKPQGALEWPRKLVFAGAGPGLQNQRAALRSRVGSTPTSFRQRSSVAPRDLDDPASIAGVGDSWMMQREDAATRAAQQP